MHCRLLDFMVRSTQKNQKSIFYLSDFTRKHNPEPMLPRDSDWALALD